MNSKKLKVAIIFTIALLCAFLFIVGVLWLLNQYGVINVQPFLDYLYYQMAELIAIISALGVGGIISIVGGVLYNSYKVEQRKQIIDTKTTQLAILERQERIESKLDSILAYETIMANKHLSNSIVPSKEDKNNLRTWIVSTSQKANELATVIKKIADIKPTIEETKAAIEEIIKPVTSEQRNQSLVKGIM